MIAYHPETEELLTVEVKTTNVRSPTNSGWVFTLKSALAHKKIGTLTQNVPFDSSKVDLIGLFIMPIGKVIFKKSSSLLGYTSAITIKDDELEKSQESPAK